MDGTSGTVLAIDKYQAPTGGVLMYNDPCPDADIVKRISKHAPQGSAAVGANSGLARAIFLAREVGVDGVLHQADWILMMLGCPGRVSDENNALKSGYDLLLQDWPDWIETAGMDRAKLPEVFRAGKPIAKMDGYLKDREFPDRRFSMLARRTVVLLFWRPGHLTSVTRLPHSGQQLY